MDVVFETFILDDEVDGVFNDDDDEDDDDDDDDDDDFTALLAIPTLLLRIPEDTFDCVAVPVLDAEDADA